MLINFRPVVLCAALALGSLLSGCATENNTVGNTMPWAGRGNGSEGGLPGMSGFTGNANTPTGGNGLR